MAKCPRPGEKCQEYSCGSNDEELCKVDMEKVSGMIRAYDDNGNVVDLVEREKQIRADAIDECIKFLIDYFGVAEAKKYGNKTKEQLEISYKSWMNYEIKEGIEELEGLKGKDINVTTKKGEQNGNE